jgi:hypothetical protein
MKLVLSIPNTIAGQKRQQIIDQLARACRSGFSFPLEVCGVKMSVELNGPAQIAYNAESGAVIIFDERDETREQAKQGNAILALLYANAVKKGDMSNGMTLDELQEAFDDDAVPVLVEALVRQGLAIRLRDVVGLTPTGIDAVVES